jgi:hypothetical protein
MSVARRLPSAPVQISPGIAHPPSRLCPSDIRHGVPYKFRASQILACSPRRAASYPLPVRQASALPSASSRFPVAQNTLAVRLTLPLVGQVEDFHLQVSAPCRAHQRKGAPGGFRGAPGWAGKGSNQTTWISICSPVSGSLTWTAQAMQGSKEWMVRWISIGCLTLCTWWLSCSAAS